MVFLKQQFQLICPFPEEWQLLRDDAPIPPASYLDDSSRSPIHFKGDVAGRGELPSYHFIGADAEDGAASEFAGSSVGIDAMFHCLTFGDELRLMSQLLNPAWDKVFALLIGEFKSL